MGIKFAMHGKQIEKYIIYQFVYRIKTKLFEKTMSTN